MIENKLNEEKRDDSKDIITIDYYDRIHKQWIKLDVTKEVARLLKSEDQKMRRSNNRYNYYNLPFDEVFDSDKNEELLIDESATMDFEDIEILRDVSDEERRTIIENSLDCLTDDQREVVEMAYFKRPMADHFDSPSNLSLTSNSTVVLLKPTQNEIALKKPFLSGILLSISTTLRSRSLKSDEFAISNPATRLITE